MATVTECLFLDAVPGGAPPTAVGDLRAQVVTFLGGTEPALLDLFWDAGKEAVDRYLNNPFVEDWRVPDDASKNPPVPIPMAVRLGLYKWLERQFGELEKGNPSIGSVKTGDLQVNYDVTLTIEDPEVKRILQPWRFSIVGGSRRAYLLARGFTEREVM